MATVGRKLKVARIIGRLNVGGPARQVCFLHQALRARYDTVLITGRIDEGEADMTYLLSSQEGVRWVPSMSRPVKLWSDLLALWRVFRILRHERPDIVHTHTAKAGALGRAAAVLAGVPVRLHSYHGHVFRGYFGGAQVWLWLAIERFLAHFTTRIVAITPSLAKELAQQYYIAPAEKIVVIRNGFDLQRLGDARPRERVRREFGIGDSDFLVLWVGRMVTVKNVALLGHIVRAAAKLPRIQFLVVGDGPDRGALQELTSGFGNVHFTGWRTEVAELWAAADAALLTSLNEGTPTALIEAMAAAKPFVSTDTGGVIDLAAPPLVESSVSAVKQAANGFLSAPDPAAMVQALQLLHDDPALAQTMGQAGREFVCSLYTEERLLRDMTTLYEEVADSRTRQKVSAAARHAGA